MMPNDMFPPGTCARAQHPMMPRRAQLRAWTTRDAREIQTRLHDWSRKSWRPKKKPCQGWFRRLAALGWPRLDAPNATSFLEGGTTVMSTLAVVEEILRETAVPMSVREIVERAGARLPSKSKTPDTVVARDLSMDIKRRGDTSLFVRTSPGRYTLRTLAGAVLANDGAAALRAAASPGPSMSALPQRKPAAAAPPPARARDSDVQGGGFAG
jgi:uncharacterized protein (UPF0147 family)